jgi:hypothetical protein
MGLQDYMKEAYKTNTIETGVWEGNSGPIGLFST